VQKVKQVAETRVANAAKKVVEKEERAIAKATRAELKMQMADTQKAKGKGKGKVGCTKGKKVAESEDLDDNSGQSGMDSESTLDPTSEVELDEGSEVGRNDKEVAEVDIPALKQQGHSNGCGHGHGHGCGHRRGNVADHQPQPDLERPQPQPRAKPQKVWADEPLQGVDAIQEPQEAPKLEGTDEQLLQVAGSSSSVSQIPPLIEAPTASVGCYTLRSHK
jgi:hypothetical protein